MKKLPLFLTMVLLCISFISALEFSAEYDTNILVRDMENSIELTLKIENASEGTYNLYTLSDISIHPSETFVIGDDPFEKKFTMTAKDNLDVEGYYSFTYTLNHRNVEKFDKNAN